MLRDLLFYGPEFLIQTYEIYCTFLCKMASQLKWRQDHTYIVGRKKFSFTVRASLGQYQTCSNCYANETITRNTKYIGSTATFHTFEKWVFFFATLFFSSTEAFLGVFAFLLFLIMLSFLETSPRNIFMLFYLQINWIVLLICSV